MLQDGLQVNQGSVGFFSRMVHIVCKDLPSAFRHTVAKEKYGEKIR